MSYGTKVLEGSAEDINRYANILQSQLTFAGLKPKHEVTNLGNCFRLSVGIGTTARVYYKSVGRDIVITPEVTRSFLYVFILPILICLGICPGIIYYIWTNRNMYRALARISFCIELSMSMYNSASSA